MSLADAKLERQRKRIDAADAALAAPLPLDRRQGSRTKGGKVWKPFDYTSAPSNVSNESGGGVAVSEVRVNTFRASSRASSLSRPVSAMSYNTSDAEANDGFQLFKSRRTRRDPLELGTHESKPELRQTTVEATPDMREIHEVFGKSLPGPEYLEQNAGYKTGQVEFLQHPNGDVSAQQWSAERFEWANLGQFSNIRKKVEGQLASDRLKGETAYQTLQQGTLQYFRIIAKQREASAMGIPFGPKDVQAAMPEPTMPSGVDSQTVPFDMTARMSLNSAPLEKAGKEVSPPPAYAPKEPATQRWEVTGLQGGASHDPFTSPQSVPMPREVAQYPAYPQYPAYHQGHQVPTSNSTMQSPGAQKYFADRAALASKMQAHWQQVYSQGAYRVAGAPGGQAVPPEFPATRGGMGVYQPPEMAHPKPVTSVNRTAMRDQLIKLGETAKERSLSQANIRTVLHDPFQSEASPYKSSTADRAPGMSRDMTSRAPQPESPVAIHSRKVNILQHSSPDTQWSKRPYEHSTPLLTRSLASESTPLTSHQPKTLATVHQELSSKTYEECLNDWWTNGNTFARQEDLYQQVKEGNNTQLVQLAPIAPPSKATSSSPEITTRLLIPVLENLASYVQGPEEKRRDYWCQWVQAPEWCIDRSPTGNDSFFEADWGSPPQRIGRDPRYAGSFRGGSGGSTSTRKVSRGDVGHVGVVGSTGVGGWQGVSSRFANAGRF